MLKKTLLFGLSVALMATACQKSDKPGTENEEELAGVVSQRTCPSHELLEAEMAADPARRKRMEALEAFTARAIANGEVGRLVNGVIEIPVVVNVLYRSTSENISLTQIQSQIDVLNEDFNGTNPDFSSVPALFSGVKANVGIRFVLDQVIRKQTNKRSWSTNNDIKRTSRGGLDPTSPSTKLNVWVGTLGNGLLGYAQFPGGALATDGVVILNTAFGRTGSVRAPFNKGRTTTHEVGHWLNLRHIWGDATCGSDFVNDTPVHNTANYGCPAFPSLSTCAGTPTEMTMNYMDYTDDACMYMFSVGQKDRMNATFVSGGPRNSFAQP